ncbi:MAG: L-threonylcarbamoyladenylate synthase [Candidatus Latescibacterota bacterium]
MCRIKAAEPGKPFSFICTDLKDLSRYAVGVSNYAYQTMRHLLPGPYTFVLRASKMVPHLLQSRQKTVGIRIPDNEICLAIVRELGHPLLSTSVAPPRDEVLSDPEEIHARFGKQVDLVIDGGMLLSDLSSVVDLSGDVPLVIREGKGSVRFFLE